MTQEILQSLPATRQRHSLLTVGKNLVNIPDDDPRQAAGPTSAPTSASLPATPAPTPTNIEHIINKPEVVFTNSSQQPSVVPASSNSGAIPKPLKKRMIPSDLSFGGGSNENAAPQTNGQKAPPVVANENHNSVGLIRRAASLPSPTLLDLSEAASRSSLIDSQKFRIPSPSSSQFRKSLLRNSPINLSMDRRNAHIISPLARANSVAVTKNIAPSAANCRKISPTGINLSTVRRSPTTVLRSPPTQSVAVVRSKPYSPSSHGATSEKYHPKIKYLRVQQQQGGGSQPLIAVKGTTHQSSTTSSGVLGLSKGNTLIALLPPTLSPKNHQGHQNILRSPNERRVLSPLRAAPNSPLNLKIHVNHQQ